MIQPARLYVTADEILMIAGRPVAPNPATDPRDVIRADGIAELASIIVEHIVGEAGVIRHLLPVSEDAPPPSGAHEATLTIGNDLWRRPTTPGGYFQVVDYVGRFSSGSGVAGARRVGAVQGIVVDRMTAVDVADAYTAAVVRLRDACTGLLLPPRA